MSSLYLKYHFINSQELKKTIQRDKTESSTIVSLKITLEWISNPISDQDLACSTLTAPWWLSSHQSSEESYSSRITSQHRQIACGMHFFSRLPSCLAEPGVPSLSHVGNAQIVSTDVDNLTEFPPAWTCLQCGRLHSLHLFQCKWPFFCQSCGVRSFQL